MILSAQSVRLRCTLLRSSAHSREDVDHACRMTATGEQRLMIVPFRERTPGPGGVSHGLSAAGYDVRIAEDVELWHGQFVLASTMERFAMPLDVMGIVHDKSTWARKGLAVQNTVIEPGWCGYLTLELTNHGSQEGGHPSYFPAVPVCLSRGDGIAQIVFHQLDHPTHQPYAAGDKYQDQAAGPQPAILTRSTP